MDIVIVGASHAGISAAVNLMRSIKSDNRQHDIKVTLLEQGDGSSLSFVGADGLLWVSGDIEEKHMGYTDVESVRNKGIDLQVNSEVVSINPKLNEVETIETSFHYDYLILATGSHPIVPDFAQNAIENGYDETSGKPVQTMKSKDDALAMKKLVDDDSVKKIAVIGGGYIGVETAETLMKCGKNVKIVQGADRLVNTYYDPEFSALLEERLNETVDNLGKIEVVTNKRFEKFDDPEFNDCDAFILSIGFAANSELLVPIDSNVNAEGFANRIDLVRNAYKVDEFQRTITSNIFAIGDCSASFNNALQDYMYIGIGSNTARGANIVADVVWREIQGLPLDALDVQRNRGTQGSNALSILDLNLASTGLTEESAKKFGINAISLDFSGTVIAPYLHNRFVDGVQELGELENGTMKIRIVFDSKSRRLLGFQAATHLDPSSFVNMFSLAIERGLTVDEIKNTDLFFLPQLNQLYNHLTRALSKLPPILRSDV
jgi:NADPH-dependent 2,4-dienoyl-CoA reductase/sulfur reductase-like enzyme